MDVIFTISEHSKNVFENSKFEARGPNGQPQGIVQLQKPVEVLHNCIDTAVFGKKAPTDASITKVLDGITENFCFLFVGHWLRGDLGEDRKNVGFLIKLFFEAFKQVTDKPQPALILKTSSAGFSILDREEILNKINQIKASVQLERNQKLPNVYLLHGELTDTEMNTLYNHSKVKAHISFTKGEGFGRPLLEASISGKPVIASGWSGHLDFLDKNGAVLVGGELKNVHPSAAWENVLIQESSWFNPDPQQRRLPVRADQETQRGSLPGHRPRSNRDRSHKCRPAPAGAGRAHDGGFGPRRALQLAQRRAGGMAPARTRRARRRKSFLSSSQRSVRLERFQQPVRGRHRPGTALPPCVSAPGPVRARRPARHPACGTASRQRHPEHGRLSAPNRHSARSSPRSRSAQSRPGSARPACQAPAGPQPPSTPSWWPLACACPPTGRRWCSPGRSRWRSWC